MTSVLDHIGNTPLVRLNRSLPPESRHATVLAKLEFQNPGGSVKDRIALRMIEDAEKQGLISPDKTTVIEYTSGNTGIGLAMVCAAKGYKCIIVMPQLPTMAERYLICRKFGAHVHLTAPSRGLPGMQEHVENLLAQEPDKYWCPRQFQNPSNPEVHYDITGPEIWEQTGGKIDYFVAGIGTAGTLTGVARFLKEKNPAVVVVGVEPTESRVNVGLPHARHLVVGIGPGVPADFLQQLSPPGADPADGPRGPVDEFLHASSQESMDWADRLARLDGILAGPSSGCVAKVAADLAARPEAAGKTVVAVLASSAVRYLGHPMWAPERQQAEAALPSDPDMAPLPLLRYASDASP